MNGGRRPGAGRKKGGRNAAKLKIIDVAGQVLHEIDAKEKWNLYRGGSMQISGWLSRLKDRSRAKSRARRERVVSPQNWMGDRRLRIRSAHGRDRNDAATSPTLALVRQQVLDPEMPNFTVTGNELSNLLFTGSGTVGNVPTKTITLYNNTDQTIYPFLYDANNGFAGGPYDPFDAHAQEYRLYVGYQS